MKKDLGVVQAVYPMPVLIVAAYDEDGKVNAMNAAWGMICNSDRIALFIDEDHKTTQNILKTKAFTVKITGTLTYATRITGARKLSRRNLKLAWKRIGGVRGYEVYRSTSLRGTYRRVKTVSGITCIDRNLTTNRNYYYKVRAYKIIGNKKYYTPFSGAKKIRM